MDQKTSQIFFSGALTSLQPPRCTQHICITCGADSENNITHTQHFPTCCFLCIQVSTGLYSQQSRTTMPIVTLHQENFMCSQTLSMNLQHSSKCQPFLATPSFPQPYLSQSDTEHQYSLSSNDKLGSLPGILQSNCHNLISLLILPTQYLNTIFVTILLPCLHEWLPCIQLLQLRVPVQPIFFSSN